MTLYTVITGRLEKYEPFSREICHYSNYAEAKKAFKEAYALVVTLAKEDYMPFQITPRESTLRRIEFAALYPTNVNYTLLNTLSQETIKEGSENSAYLIYFAALMKAEI